MSETITTHLITVGGWFVFGLVALFALRGPLSNFLSKSTKMTVGGVSAEIQEQPQKPVIASPSTNLADLPAANDFIREVETHVLTAIANANPASEEVKTSILIRWLASAWIRTDFEQLDRFIFGSQLQALNEANSVGGLTLERARQIHADAVSKYPVELANNTFEAWLGWLQNAGLLAVEGVNYVSSIKGQTFLEFLPAFKRTGRRVL